MQHELTQCGGLLKILNTQVVSLCNPNTGSYTQHLSFIFRKLLHTKAWDGQDSSTDGSILVGLSFRMPRWETCRHGHCNDIEVGRYTGDCVKQKPRGLKSRSRKTSGVSEVAGLVSN